MPRKSTPRLKVTAPNRDGQTKALTSMPAAEALSFLRETRGISTWKPQDVAKSLRISLSDAKEVIAVLELQGYVKPAQKDEWMTTLSGESVSGSKTPRYTRERVEEALSSLSQRIAEINRDRNAPYQVVHAVAFGDFMSDRPQLQSAEVGIQLASRQTKQGESDSATEHKRQRAFLKQLQGKGSLLRLKPYEQWMSVRTHRKLL